MTTRLPVRAGDLFVRNDVLKLPRDPRIAGLQLAGAGWLAVGEPPMIAHQNSLIYAEALVRAKLPGYSFWLLACHSAWQPDTRIVRHNQLWASFKARGLDLPSGRFVSLGLVEGAKGIRFFGALQLEAESFKSTASILEAEPASYLVALRHHHQNVVETLVRSGWERGRFGPAMEVLAAVCGSAGVVFSLVGAFDDREAGCVAIATSQTIEQFFR